MMGRFRRQASLTTGRIEAFSDGVFAIAITLLVLEIGVPELGEADSLVAALGHLWPSYFGYAFGFFIVGVYWVNHHHLFSLFRRSDHVFGLVNVLFLATIAFIPFPTSVLAEYATQPTHQAEAIGFYLFALILPALAWNLVWLYASVSRRLIDERLAPAYVRHLTVQFALSIATYTAAFALALVAPEAGLAVAVGVSLLYVMPPRRPEYLAEPVASTHGV